MLEPIFGSEIRVKILNLLLLSPDKKYSLALLAKGLRLPSPTLRRELKNLEEIGLVKTELVVIENIKKPSNQIIFSANTSAFLYEELKALFAKAQILFSEKFVKDLKKICHLKFLALTGSFINYPQAQTDILLVGSIRRAPFLKLITALERDLGREVNFTVFSEEEFNYRHNVMDIFLYNIIEGKMLILINDLKI